MNNSKWGSFNKAELISFLEAVTFYIGVTEKRAFFIEHVKKEIGFSPSDYYYDISRLSLDVNIMYIQKFHDPFRALAKQYLLKLVSCDPVSPITKLGLNQILKISKLL